MDIMETENNKGICKRRQRVHGLITVTDKGQVAIPVEIRKELGIEQGSKLLVVKRDDGKGINLIKTDVLDDFVNKLSKN
jgi:AbrB family looped-hinge helix DNA binding protein